MHTHLYLYTITRVCAYVGFCNFSINSLMLVFHGHGCLDYVKNINDPFILPSIHVLCMDNEVINLRSSPFPMVVTILLFLIN